MPSKQTRRSISVRGTTYDHLRHYCEAHSLSMSQIVEEQLAQLFAKEQKRPETRAHTIAPRVARAPVAARQTAVEPRGTPGRPAPTPAAQVLGAARPQSPKNDYRTIRF